MEINNSKWDEAKSHVKALVMLLSKRQQMLAVLYVLYCLMLMLTNYFVNMFLLPPAMYFIWLALVRNVFGIPKWLNYKSEPPKHKGWLLKNNRVHKWVCALDTIFLLFSAVMIFFTGDKAYKELENIYICTLCIVVLANIIGVVLRFFYKHDCPVLLFLSVSPIVCFCFFYGIRLANSSIISSMASCMGLFIIVSMLITFFSHWYYAICKREE